MIEPNIYCKVAGMTMQCIAQLNSEGIRLPKVIEVGCADGLGTMRYAGFCELVIAIDAMATGRPDLVYDGSSAPPELDRSKFADFKRRTRELPVELVVGLSIDPSTVQAVETVLTSHGQVDVLIIDGVHHPEEAVWADVETYLPFLRSGGYIVLDDLYEDDIERPWQRLLGMGYAPLDRWGVKRPDILQECGALRKP